MPFISLITHIERVLTVYNLKRVVKRVNNVAQTFLSAGYETFLSRFRTGGWKTARTRRLESLRYNRLDNDCGPKQSRSIRQ